MSRKYYQNNTVNMFMSTETRRCMIWCMTKWICLLYYPIFLLHSVFVFLFVMLMSSLTISTTSWLLKIIVARGNKHHSFLTPIADVLDVKNAIIVINFRKCRGTFLINYDAHLVSKSIFWDIKTTQYNWYYVIIWQIWHSL